MVMLTNATLRIGLSAHPNIVNKTVASTSDYATGWDEKRWTAHEITQHVISGGAISVALVSDRYRDEAHFVSSQIIGIDFDAGPDVEALEQDDWFINEHAFLVYSTTNSTPEKPRSRALFLLDQPVTNPNEYRRLVLRLMYKYGHAIDNQCKDPVRIFYGSRTPNYYSSNHKVLPVDVLRQLPEMPTKTDNSSAPDSNIDRPIADIIQNGAARGSRDSDALRMVGYLSNLMSPSAVEAIMQLWYGKLPDTSDFPFATVQGMIKRMGQKSSAIRTAVQDIVQNVEKVQTPAAAQSIYTPFAQFAVGEEQEITWAIDQWLPDATSALMVAPPGSFKTWLALAIGLALSTGKPLFGKYAVRQSAPVLVIQQEDAKGILRQRLRTIYTSMFETITDIGEDTDDFSIPLIMPDLDVYTAEETLRLDDENKMSQLAALIAARGYKLVVIDPLYSMAGSEDYMAKDAQRMIQFKRLRDKYGVSFLILHHTRKTTNEKGIDRLDAWGSQFLNAWLETRIQIAKGPADNIIKVERSFKSSSLRPKEQLTFDIDTESEERRFNVLVDGSDSKAVATTRDDLLEFIKLHTGIRNTDVAKFLSISASSASRRLASMVKAGTIVKSDDGEYVAV